MRALQITTPGRTDLVDIATPSPGDGEVLLRVHVIGYCGSDLKTFRGSNPLVQYPRVPGHEIGAVIAGRGPHVPAEWEEGLAVTLSPYTHCERCAACRQGRPNCCRHNQTLGVQREGALAEYIVAPWRRLYRSGTLSLRELALVEPLTVGFHAVDRGRVAAQDTLVVFGCGAIGLGVIAGGASRRARVIAVDIDDGKLVLARQCGAALTINSEREPLHARLQDLTSGEGPEVVIEAVGMPQTFRAAVEEVSFAGRVVYIGYSKQPVEYDTRHFVMKELDILGSRNATPQDFRAVIQMLETRAFPVESVISRTVSLAEAGAALQAWSDHPAAITKLQVALAGGRE
ncbi:MAG: zinc-binding alcohol dehydrogenase family protein [Lentisphaerae bacterium]|nr:zinc-binding alcohol dehydrogenase family protein [Lentisphaerota bacterium]